MKQKIVIKVCTSCGKCRSKAMGLVASVEGVQGVAIEGNDGDRLAVTGECVDSVALTCLLRRKIGNAELLTVEEVKTKVVKPPPVTPPPPPTTTTTKNPQSAIVTHVSPQQWIPSYSYGFHPWPATVYGLPAPQ